MLYDDVAMSELTAMVRTLLGSGLGLSTPLVKPQCLSTRAHWIVLQMSRLPSHLQGRQQKPKRSSTIHWGCTVPLAWRLV